MKRLLLSLMLLPLPSLAAKDLRNTGPDGLALQGYDAVEYVDFDTALKGFSDIEATYEGARYRFRSRENRRRFLENPQRYLPAFGGWCAYSLAMDDETGYPRGRYPVNPESFRVFQGRLYLFYNEDGFNGLERWLRDPQRYREIAREEWRRMMAQGR